MISATIVGRLGGDPETRNVKDTSVTTLSIASSHYAGKGNDGKAKYDTTWIRCEIWGDRGLSASKYLSKGDQVIVRGEVFEETWTDKEGHERKTLKMRGDGFEFGAKKNGDNDQKKGGYGGGKAGDDLPF